MVFKGWCFKAAQLMVAIGSILVFASGLESANAQQRSQKTLSVLPEDSFAFSTFQGYGSWAVYGPSSLSIAKADGSEARRIFTTAGEQAIFGVSVSPDRSKIAFVVTTSDNSEKDGWQRDKQSSIYTVNPDGSGLQRITPLSVLAWHPTWSPDGKELVFDGFKNSERKPQENSPSLLFTVDANGKNLTQVTSKNDPNVIDRLAAWLPDKRLLYSHIDIREIKERKQGYPINIEGLSTSDLNGREIRDFMVNERCDYRMASVSKDGQKVAVLKSCDGIDRNYLYVSKTDGSAARELDLGKGAVGNLIGVSWSPDGKQLLLSGFSSPIFAEDDGSKLTKLTTPAGFEGTQVMYPSWSTYSTIKKVEEEQPKEEVSGKVIALDEVIFSGAKAESASLQQTELFAINVVTGKQRKLLTAPAGKYIDGVALSPDRDTVALTFVDYGMDISQLYTVSVDSKKLEPVFSNDAYVSDPAWSPDGKRLLFTIKDGLKQHIYSATSDGSDLQQLTTGEVADSDPSLREIVGEETLIFVRRSLEKNTNDESSKQISEAGSNITVMTSKIDGSEPTTFLSDADSRRCSLAKPRVSPDGTQAAAVATCGTQTADRLVIYPTTGSPAERQEIFSLDMDTSVDGPDFSWSPDGRSLLIIQNGLQLLNLESGQRSEVKTKAYGFSSPARPVWASP